MPDPEKCDICDGTGTVIDFTIESTNRDVTCTACEGTGVSPDQDEQPST